MTKAGQSHAEYMREYYKTRPEQLEKKRQRDRDHYHKNREARLAYVKQHYEENKESIKEKNRVLGRAQRIRLRDEAMTKLGGACMDCKIANPIVLQFHHRDATQKLAEVMSLATSTKKFWEEVAKCDLVCANCHLIRHKGGADG